MGLDIRWPIGLMFTLIGALLAVFGAVVQSDHAISLGININLVWGVVLLAFGILMLLGAAKGGKTPPSA
jgi:ABC-type Fe3+-siderophore transport system permease subunit